MAVVAELIHLGLLGKEAYQDCLHKFIVKEEIDVKTCETLFTLIKAWENERNFRTCADEPLLKTYIDLLQYYLFPQLTAIIVDVEADLPNQFEHFKAVESQIRIGNAGKAPTISTDPSTIRNSQNVVRYAKFNLDIEQKAVEINELILAPKIIDLIMLVVKFLLSSHEEIDSKLDTSEEFHSSIQRIYALIGETFDLIGKNLHECGCQRFTKHDQHRVKFLSLIFTNLVMANEWLYSDSSILKQQLKSVIEVVLAVIQSSHDSDITALLLNLIIHPFLETFPEEQLAVVSSLWNIVLNYYVIKDGFVMEEANSTGFLILCFMAEYIFDTQSLCNIRNDDRFYIVLQFGLIHLDALTRKRSQFILKRAVDFCVLSKFDLISSNCFLWKDADKLNLQNSWNDFFLLCETLEEKQSHVIWPVLDKLDKFIEIISTRLIHVSWMLVIFKRIFDHDNKGIKVWGVMKLLKLKLSDFMLTNGVLSFVNSHLLMVLSDYSLFGQEPGHPRMGHSGMSSSVGEEFANFLVSIVSSLESDHLKYFMQSILENIFDGRTWGGIPLFYIIQGLSVIPSTRLWSYGMVKSALVKFEGCLSTQEVVIRSASQCGFLRAVLDHLEPKTSLIELCNIVRHFRRKESWCRGTITWKVLIESIDNFDEKYENTSGSSSIEDSLNLSLKSSVCKDSVVPPHDVALGICLLLEKYVDLDCETERKNRIHNLLQPITSFLSDCHLRPYLDQQKYVWVLTVLCQMLEICNDTPEGSLDIRDITGTCLSSMQESFTCVVQLFHIHVRGFDHLGDLEMMSLYLDLFAQFHQASALSHVVESQYADIFALCQTLLAEENDVKVSLGIILLEYLLRYHFDQSAVSAKQEIAKVTISEVLQNVEEITRRRQVEGYAAAKSAGKVQLEVTRSCWSCIELLVNKTATWTDGVLLNLREDIEAKSLVILMEAITIAGRVNVFSVFKTCVELAHIIIKEHLWHVVVEQLWMSSLEFKKCCDLYRSLMKCLSEVLFHPRAILQEECSHSMEKISQNLLDAAEVVQGIASHMARSLIQSLTQATSDESFSITTCENVFDLLIILVRFGTVFRKQQKIIKDTMTYVQNCSELYSTNLLLETVESDHQARAVVLRYFLSLDMSRSQDRIIAGALFKSLKHHYAQCSGDRRDFANSQKHRNKTRLLQAFMVLLPLLSEAECSDAIAWLCRGLIKDHQQPSVRYMQEWGISIIIIYHPSLFAKFFELFVQGTKERVGCVGSFLASLTHIACTSEDVSVLCHSIQYTLPWCMAQHFNTRLYAQVSLRKIWQHCESKNITEVLNQYRAVQHCLQFVTEQGNAVRNTVNMLNDFYFKVFHPLGHYTLETIFYDLPCLSLLSDDEWVTVDSLLNVVDVSVLPISSDLPLHNDDKVLAESMPAPWVVKAAVSFTGETSPPEDQDDAESNRSVVQKKMTPWKSMMPELACSLGLPHQKSANQQRGGLIIVASLIDKAPNLGGLCRTCEVFSVKEYVVPSLAIQEDHNFNSLSLTAQQWVPMKEVKPENLPAYLRALQSEGYTLVAAEQTANSKLLSEFEFPQMTVVILGNEREGIPCDLLQLLDVCVEIPQTGIIRSLNVHVSGALFVWEYTRQHLKKA